jgi:hypothetical protein
VRLKSSDENLHREIGRNGAKFLIRLFSAFLLMGTVFYIIGPFYVRLFFPIFSSQIEFLHPEYKVIYSDVTKIRQIDYFQFDIKVNKPSPPGYQIPGETGNVTRHKGQASALILAPIIIFSLILSWPSLSIIRRLLTFAFSIPLIILIECLDYPMIFIANIESVFSPDSSLITLRKIWSHILNNGGRQFLSVIGFFMLIAPYYLKSQAPPPPETGNAAKPVGKNAPCPCGSGKKHKNCCGEKSLKIDQKI